MNSQVIHEIYTRLFIFIFTQDADLVQQILRNPNILINYFKRDGMYKYRHILIDEAQDHSGEWLRLFKNLLNKTLASSIWVFSDSYQVVRREIDMPDKTQKEDFQERTLRKVVRNTHEVFNAYQHVFADINATESSSKPVVEHNVYGVEPEYIVAQNEEEIQDKVLEKLKELLEKKVSNRDLEIAVITHGNSHSFLGPKPSDTIRKFLESNEISCTDAEEGTRMRHYKKIPRNKVIVDTVQRFKGLEAKVLIFCIVGDWKPRDVDVYVAFSRSFCHLIVIGKSDTITEIKTKQKES